MYVALEWVRDNIAMFGGDPDDVTIMGLSAAAHGVSHRPRGVSEAIKLTGDPDWSLNNGCESA
jgi:triacylglycerol lipase